MTIDDKIWDENLQYNINREAQKMSILPSSQIYKYECLTGEEIQSQIIKQPNNPRIKAK